MNKFIGMGRLTKDPEIRLQNGTEETKKIARYNIAIDRRNEGADFIPCVAFGKAADFAEKYLKKGTKVVVEGRVQTGSYTNKDGQTVYTTDIIVENQEFAESKRTDNSFGTNSNNGPTSDGFMNIPEGIDEDLPFAKPSR